MVLRKIIYFIDGKKKIIQVNECKSIFSKIFGLMFKENSPPLLFIFDRIKFLSIHSFFCKPFKAVWLDDKMHSTKVVDVKNWKINISGRGKYLLEIPEKFK
jgi:uncharacterized membrane protein (UPF0127 family)